MGSVNTPGIGVNMLWASTERPQARVVDGGYVLLDAAAVALFAAARGAGLLRPRDVAGLIAIAEMTERRKFTVGMVAYLTEEFSKLLGVGLRRATMMLGRLRRAGLVVVEGKRVSLVRKIEGHPLEAEARRVMEAVGKRWVVIPRPFLRWLCRDGEPATIWTAIGHASRAIFRHAGGVRSTGTCKASWLASWAPVASRSIKRAREGLRSLGWLKSIERPQWHLNRSGPMVEIDVGWRAPLAPPDAQGRAPLAPPCLRPSLSSENADRAPRLDAPRRSDLESPERVAALYRQAVEAGKAADTHDGAFRFAAIVAKVKRTARSIPRLMRWMLEHPESPSRADIECARETAERIKPRRQVRLGAAPAATFERVRWEATPIEREAFRPDGWLESEERALPGLPEGEAAARATLVCRGVDAGRASTLARARFGILFVMRRSMVDPCTGMAR